MLALEESSRSESAGDREARAEEAADRCFSRTLFPRALQAGVLRLRGCVSAALEALEGLLVGEGAKDAQLQAWMGVVKLNRQQADAGLARLNEALALDPRNELALFTRAQVRLRQNPPALADAVRDLTMLGEVRPTHLDGRVLLAEALRLQFQPEAAARELEDVLRRAPAVTPAGTRRRPTWTTTCRSDARVPAPIGAPVAHRSSNFHLTGRPDGLPGARVARQSG